MKDKITKYSVWILILFHIVGIGLFLLPNRVEGLSGLNMLLCSLLLFLAAKDKLKEAFLLLFIFLGGFAVEVIGVNTGLLFGTYDYGTELGWKIGGVPYVLGLNWYCIVAASTHLVLKSQLSNSLWIQGLMVAVLCVFMDFLIEPVAMAYGFWSWEGNEIPLFNYVCWGLFSALFAFVYLNYVKVFNQTTWALYFIWAAFFFILNFSI